MTCLDTEILGAAIVNRLKTAEKQCLGSDPPTHLINMSFNYGTTSEELSKTLNRMGEKTIMVVAAGNDFPEPIKPTMRSFPGIRVGALEADGSMTDYSQSDEQVDISAPSGSEIQTVTKDKRLASFSGTSAATPLVTAALANAMEILPGLTLEEARQLLKKTAFRTAAFMGPEKGNGAGALNAYKMARVAERLRTQSEPGWPENRKRLFEDESLWDYKAEAQGELEKAQNMIDQQVKGKAVRISCPDQERIYRMLRSAAMMDPDNQQARRSLADLYRLNGLTAQADYVDPPTPLGMFRAEAQKLMRAIGAKEMDFQKLAIRASRMGIPPTSLGPQFVAKLLALEDGKSMVSYQRGRMLLSLIPGVGVKGMLPLLAKEYELHPEVGQDILYELPNLFSQTGQEGRQLEFLTAALALPKSEQREHLVKVGFYTLNRGTKASELMPFYEKAAQDPSPEVREQLYDSIHYQCSKEPLLLDLVRKGAASETSKAAKKAAETTIAYCEKSLKNPY